MPRLLLLVPKRFYRTDAFLQAAERLGVQVQLVSDRCRTVSRRWPDGSLPIEFHRFERDLPALLADVREAPVDGVLGVDDLTSVLAAQVAHALGKRHADPQANERARHKRLQRERLRDAGLRIPPFVAARLDDDPHQLSTRLPYPCVVKPVALSASRGVIRADDPQQFVAAVERIRRIVRAPDVQVRRDVALEELLVEQFIPGMEYALEGLLEDGRLHVLALFDKPDPLNGPYFEETLYVTPSRLPLAQQEAIAETIADAAAALGLREGPVHAEVRLNEEGVWVLEVAARTIGGLCARTLRFGAGVSLEELVVAHAVGLRPPSLERERTPAGVLMVPIPQAGVLRQVHGLDEARAVAGVEDVVISVQPGEPLVPLPEGEGYLGFVFARAASPAQVEEALREAHRRLRFVIDPVLPIARVPAKTSC